MPAFPPELATALQEHFSLLATGRMPEPFADAVEAAPPGKPGLSDYEHSCIEWAGAYMAAAEAGRIPGVDAAIALGEVIRRFRVGRRAAQKWRKMAKEESDLLGSDPALLVRQMEISGLFYTQPRLKELPGRGRKRRRER